jgi:anti-sigma factor RsiW
MKDASARPSPACRRRLMELSRYLDGELSPARRRTIEQHIGACACCATMARRMRQTVAACRAEGRRRPPRAVLAQAAERIRALAAPSPPRRRRTDRQN